MKIILSIDALDGAMTGIGRYTWELLKGIRSDPRIEELRFFNRTRFVSEPVLPEAGAEVARPRRTIVRRALRAGYRLAGPVIQWYQFRKVADSIFHATNFYLPPFPGKSVVTIHDLSVLRFPDYHPADRVAHLRQAIPDAVRRASLVLTDSEFIRSELMELYPEFADKIVAVPLAFSSEFHPRTSDETEQILKRYGLLHGRYCLYVGTIEPRKNILTLLAAYKRLDQEIKETYPLVLSGHPGWHSQEIHTAIAQAEREGWCRYLGYLPASDLPVLYSGARCFAFPSVYEGFGLPVLEAMASGVPVITTPDSPMSEIALETALYVQPEDDLSLAKEIRNLLMNNRLNEGYSNLVRQRSEVFQWENTSRLTVNAYESILY